jgi:hypothetical protein
MGHVESPAGVIAAQPYLPDENLVETSYPQPSFWQTIEEAIPKLMEATLDRRDFLKVAFGTGVVLFSADKALEFGLTWLEREERARWNECAVSNRKFYENHQMEFANMELATTFIPGGSLQGMNTPEGRQTLREDKLLIKTIVEKLGIKNIRVGIKLENVIDDEGKFNFDYYKWLFDYLAEQDAKITVTLGIKNTGYPEVFLPRDFMEKHHLTLPQGQTITLNDDIAKQSLEWCEQICIALQSYSKQVVGLQPNNEPFARFGPDQITIGNDFIVALAKLMVSYFPEAEVIVNDNIWDILARGKVADVLGQLKSRGVRNGIFGLNHYPFIDQLQRFDPTLLRNLPGASLDQEINRVMSMGLNLRFTEVQAESYGEATGWDGKKPGDSATAYRHALFGAMSLVPGMKNRLLPEKVIFSTWTARGLASALIYPHEMTPDKAEMIELTKMITSKAA